MKTQVRAVALLCLSAQWAVAADSHAWGQEGHRIVAAIAERHLQTEAAAGVRELVGEGGLRAVANWADEIRNERRETVPWHFVDIPLRARTYDPGRDCVTPNEGDCVVAAIERFRATLADKTKSRSERAEALKFLTHLVGDIHQPLHCVGERDGGNKVEVTFFEEAINPFSQKPWTLHAVWDAGLIQRAGLSEQDYVEKLNAWINTHSLVQLQKGTTSEWAVESHRAAVETAFRLPVDKKIGASYFREGLRVVEERLAKAGVRLARILNEALAGRDARRGMK